MITQFMNLLSRFHYATGLCYEAVEQMLMELHLSCATENFMAELAKKFNNGSAIDEKQQAAMLYLIEMRMTTETMLPLIDNPIVTVDTPSCASQLALLDERLNPHKDATLVVDSASVEACAYNTHLLSRKKFDMNVWWQYPLALKRGITDKTLGVEVVKTCDECRFMEFDDMRCTETCQKEQRELLTDSTHYTAPPSWCPLRAKAVLVLAKPAVLVKFAAPAQDDETFTTLKTTEATVAADGAIPLEKV